MLIVQTLVVKVSNTSTTFSQQVEIHCRSVWEFDKFLNDGHTVV
jgi:hypothetical protein